MTDINAYEMLSEVRDNVNEASEDHWSDIEILRKINYAQKQMSMIVATSAGDWLVTSKNLTIVDSSVYLDFNMAKPIYIEHTADKYEIPIYNVRERLMTRQPSNQISYNVPDAYFSQNYLYINSESFNDTVTLWFEQRVPDLAVGQAESGSGSGSLIFQQTMYPSLIDDYYNYTQVAIYGTSSQIRNTITDYDASTRTATISGTPLTSDWYGTYPVLPSECTPAIILKATVLCLSKPSSAIDPKYYEMFKAEYAESMFTFKEWVSNRFPGSSHVRITQEDY